MDYSKPQNIELDYQVAVDVLDNDVWLVADEWHERIYEPVTDGYMSSERRLLPYSSYHEATFELREEIFRRSGIRLQVSPMRPVEMCHEALALNGAARYRPSKELLTLFEQSRWKERGRWRVPLNSVVRGPYGVKKAAHIYIVIGSDSFIGEGVLYVGQTTVGVKKRLRQHISQKSPIGQRIVDGLFHYPQDDLILEVVEIECHGYNSLNAAENYFIEEYAPTYNVMGVKKVSL